LNAFAKSVVLLTGNHLCHNPRVIKEASTLAAAGYEVRVFGAWFDTQLKSRDETLLAQNSVNFEPVIDHTTGKTARLLGRTKSKLGRVAHNPLGLENSWQLGASVAALQAFAQKSGADLFIAHSEAGMAVAGELLKNGKRVGVDMEDWFSEDLLPEARKSRPLKLLRALERKILSEGSYKTCTSRAMADALALEYGCDSPGIIYNAFHWSDRTRIDGLVKDRRDRQLPSIHWYSQTLGPGRGLEDLLAALPHLTQKAEVHLRGRPAIGFAEWTRGHTPENWRNVVFVHDLVSDNELLSRVAEHDIGFAGEQKYCRSRDLTVTNKILHYLLAGLATVASDTTGQQEVARQANGAVDLYRAGDAHNLVHKLNRLLSSPSELAKAKEAALAAAEATFCWEKQVPTLLTAVEKAFVA
jgi:glycosyltransferase involved in cell wall biosynthesis